MLRLCIAIALAIRVNAQLPYTQQQAQSFQSLSRDVLAAIAPSIDPTYKLAAQTSLTFAEDEQVRIVWGRGIDTFRFHSTLTHLDPFRRTTGA